MTGRFDGPVGLDLIVRQQACSLADPGPSTCETQGFAIVTPVARELSTSFTVARLVGGLDCADASTTECSLLVEVDSDSSAYARAVTPIHLVG